MALGDINYGGTFTIPAKRSSVDVAAKAKWGSYDPANYQYEWNGNYLDRTPNPNKKPEFIESPAMTQGRQSLQSMLSNPASYSGQLTAQNPYTSQISDTLEKYLKRTNPESLNLAEQQLQKTLGGTSYDPSTSLYYKGIRESANLNLQDALNQYARRQQLSGTLRSTPTDVGRARLLSENNANLNQVLGTLANQERQNQLSAVGQAQSLAGYMSGEQLNSLNAVQGTSEYLRSLQQSQFDKEYEEWKRKQQQQVDLSQLLYQTPATYR
jgi:hypothetical protein